MADKVLLIRFDVAEPGADADRLHELGARLGRTLRDVAPGTVTVRPPSDTPAPPGSRGVLETVGAVLVTVQASVELFRAVHAAVRDWRDRTPSAGTTSSVRVQVGDATVDIADVPAEQQEQMIAEVLRILAEGDGRS